MQVILTDLQIQPQKAVSSKDLLTIDELSQVSGLTKRTVRYYVSSGLVDRPSGETKSARYDAHHLEQIRNIKALQEKGFTLARILEVKKKTREEEINRKEIGEPLTRIEIPVDRGVSISFQQELCGLSKPQMIEIARSLADSFRNEIRKAENIDDKTK